MTVAAGFRIGATVVASVFLLAGCDTINGWFESEKPKLPGERISVLELESKLEPDQSVQDLTVALPEPYVNTEWPQAGGAPTAAMQHTALPASINEVWRSDIGEGADDEEKIVARPVAAGGTIYTMDSRALVSAFDQTTGERRWRVGLARRGEELGEIGGGLAVGSGVLVATTAYGEVYAIDPASGQYFWRVDIDGPIRGAPLVANDRVYFLASENRLKALDLRTGEEIWTHQGLLESAELIGAPSPTSSGPFILAPYSSGEIYALRADTGQSIWSDQLVRARRITPLGSINDVDGMPVIDGERVYVISQGGFLASIDLRRGNRVWDQDMAGRETPWIAGDFLYLMTSESELVCLSALDGGIRWVTQMPKYTKPNDEGDRVTWVGPVLAGDRLIIGGSEGSLWSISPYDGTTLGQVKLDAGISVAPIVVNNGLYVLTDDGDLIAYR
ncbi:PQQ-binding-like beta-propeller repeat protein [Minwuia sp.]|uniref:outer membrane protein assembly factor BamB family protein n=1 Tax=Minwuia sp. TaxID=2493630 RepID=UPI003A95AF1E